MPMPPVVQNPADASALRLVDRARVALRCGEVVAIFDEPGAFGLALAVETLTLQAMARLRLLAGCEPVLALTRWRAASLGLVAIGGSGVITFSPCVDAIVEALQAVSVEPGGRLLPFTHTGEGEGEQAPEKTQLRGSDTERARPCGGKPAGPRVSQALDVCGGEHAGPRVSRALDVGGARACGGSALPHDGVSDPRFAARRVSGPRARGRTRDCEGATPSARARA
ncbi:MAG: hypothetical protein WCK65_14140, partial [Rhodospirillaceae bacterium]